MYDYDEDKYILKSFYVSLFGLLHTTCEAPVTKTTAIHCTILSNDMVMHSLFPGIFYLFRLLTFHTL